MKSAKALGTLCLAAIAAVNTAPALATDDGWYGGIGIGQSRAKINDDKIRTQLGGTADIADDDTDIGYRLFGGKKFNKHFAVEGGYFNLGKFGFTAVAPTGSLVGSAKFQGLNLDAVGILPLTEKFSLLGRLGLTYTEAKDTFQTTGTVTVANPSPSKSEANYKMGFGVQYDLTRALGLRGGVGALSRERRDRQQGRHRHAGRRPDLHLRHGEGRPESGRSAAARARAGCGCGAGSSGGGSAGAGHRADRGEDPAVLQHSRHPVRDQPEDRAARGRGEDRQGGAVHEEVPRTPRRSSKATATRSAAPRTT